jgi:putative transposase
MGAVVPSYKGFRFPVEIISHCVWLYHRFPLNFREVEEMMMERGVAVTYETIRAWCRKFGQIYANGLRRRRSRPGDKWHLDEVFIKINGKTHYLWRAVDQDGTVLDTRRASAGDAPGAALRPRRPGQAARGGDCRGRCERASEGSWGRGRHDRRRGLHR